MLQKPFLLYEFPDQKGLQKPLLFTEPAFILQTSRIDKIPAIFRQVDQLVKKGYYAAGFVSYEAAPAFDSNMTVNGGSRLPLVWFGLFEQPSPYEPGDFPEEPFRIGEWKINTSFDSYETNIGYIKKAIEEGDTYQVNYTERLSADWEGSDFSFYRQLTRNQQSGYSAYLNIGNLRILSASPELFFSVHGTRLTAKPMKGTATRGKTTKEDAEIVQRLLGSEKEKAENLMIVDLLRNDISKIANSASVKVTSLFDVETYPTVHQLTSTIEAEIRPDSSLFDWFQALFPCGSITGAPKISTMDYITRLETAPREVYCGAIGFITPDKSAVFNVPIRTVIMDAGDHSASYGAGGGITWDSTADGEYGEIASKAKLLTAHRPVFQLLESIRLENGTYPLLAYHLNRLQDSAAYFNFQLDAAVIRKALNQYSKKYPTGTYKVRLLTKEDGDFTLESSQITKTDSPVPVVLADSPVDKQNLYLYHKTTNRDLYRHHEKTKPEKAFSVLLWNEQNELTEFTIGNLVIEQGGRFYTPPVASGLLPGTYRHSLLDQGIIEEKVIDKQELKEADKIWFINSVREWIEVKVVKF